LLEHEGQAVGPFFARFHRQPQLQQRVQHAALTLFELEPGVLRLRIGEVRDDLVQPAGAAEPVTVDFRNGPIAGGVIDLVSAKPIAFSFRDRRQRLPEIGVAVHAFESGKHRVFGHVG
jgi:hypothetical protein